MTSWEELQALAVERARPPARERRPKSRKTTTRNPRAARAECKRKHSYSSAAAARTAATTVAKANGDRRLRPYLCEVCHLYHLSSNPNRSY